MKMNRETLRKIRKHIEDKWDALSEGGQCNSRNLEESITRWQNYCERLGIGRLKKTDGFDFEFWGESLEESVVIIDPVLYGDWLEISNETAMKILTMGMP